MKKVSFHFKKGLSTNKKDWHIQKMFYLHTKTGIAINVCVGYAKSFSKI